MMMVMIQYWLSLLLLLFSLLLSWYFFKTNITMITIGFFLTINDKLFSLLIVIIGITLFSFLLSMIPYYYYQYYHDNQLWLSLASSVRWWSEDVRRGSALVADAANHTVGMPWLWQHFCGGNVGIGTFFFLDAMDFEKVKKPTKTRGFWKAKRFWETAKRSSDKSSELERVSLNEWTLLGLLHPSRAVVICCKWPSYPWDFPTVGSCQQVEVAFETVHGGIATSIYYFS